jgi:hypothetical protein
MKLMINNTQAAEWLDKGILLHPLSENLSGPQIARTLAGENIAENLLSKRLGPIDSINHIIFLIIDGLGMNLQETFPSGGFFASNLISKARAVFPSTTAAALTTFATGKWPGEHGIIGWNTHFPRFGRTVTLLPFTDRMNWANLEVLGYGVEDFISGTPLFDNLNRVITTFVPVVYKDGNFNRWAYSGGPIYGYASYVEILKLWKARLNEIEGKGEKSITFIYLPAIDKHQHESGADADIIAPFVKEVDDFLEVFVDLSVSGSCIIATADHGLLTVSEDSQIRINLDHPLMANLEVPPSCESVTPVFHVKKGKEEQFQEELSSLTGDTFSLITPEEACGLKLFGPSPESYIIRPSLGTFIGIAREPFALIFDAPEHPYPNHLGFHGGLRPAEMEVPLFFYRC